MRAKPKSVRILVTRPLEQADNLCRLIRELGEQAVMFPVLAINALTPVITPIAVINQVNRYDWVIFVSANAVRYACTNLTSENLQIANTVRVVALGKATANALTSLFWPVHLVPEYDFTSEALLASEILQQIKDQRFLVIKGQGGRNKLIQTLKQRGAIVDNLAVYCRSKPDISETMKKQALTQQLDIIVITSGEALENLLDLAGENFAILLKSIPLVVISQRIRKIAEELGFKRILMSGEPSDIAIVKTIKAFVYGT